jgi:hypothetical protein
VGCAIAEPIAQIAAHASATTLARAAAFDRQLAPGMEMSGT